ncbi:MAG: DUF262 domain-containing protein [Liquorilactobacillus satsumensis]
MSNLAGTTLTFMDLFARKGLVQIPVLQRDYAQGRETESSVRDEFLTSLRDSLCADDAEHPLDLDFIYGNTEDTDSPVFSVLDGQQRLTTLFLLHWYLALREGELASFRKIFLDNNQSRFTYKTRVSATEFFDALVREDAILLPEAQEKLSESIKNRQWFFSLWLQDPTVKGCLTMLDAMHAKFSDGPQGLYTRLLCTKSPRIRFQFLDLEKFSLSDELYIKMNGRGKILSDFENFKASWSLYLKKLPEGSELEARMDGAWTDLFWDLSKKDTTAFNALYLRFFLLMAFYRACEMTHGNVQKINKNKQDFLRKLRGSHHYSSKKIILDFKLFDQKNRKRIKAVLDYCSSEKSDSKIKELLKSVLTGENYVTEVRFYAFICFIETLQAPTDAQFRQWYRVTDNLIYNQTVDDLTIFLPVSRSLRKLSENANDLYGYLAKTDESMPGFTQEQWREEKRKCRLILSETRWETLLRHGTWEDGAPEPAYESHPYLMGQVGFVLDMSYPAGQDAPDPDLFQQNITKVCTLLSPSILASNEFLLQRALLALGDDRSRKDGHSFKNDYPLRQSGEKYSFCKPNSSSYRDREENWLRVTRSGKQKQQNGQERPTLFALLVEKIKGETQDALLQIIHDYKEPGWRRLMVEHPETFSYCTKFLIGKEYTDKEQIHLLTKTNYRGYHAELRTYVVKILLEQKKMLPAGIVSYSYQSIYGDDLPSIDVSLENGITYRLKYVKSQFVSFIKSGEREEDWEKNMPKTIRNFLQTHFPDERIVD